MNRNFLVPLDGSTESELVLTEVQRIATVRDNVHLLHVVPPLRSPAGLEAAQVIAILEQALNYLRATREKWLPGQRGLDLVRPGEPAEGILGLALEKNINLIAMTTHARHGLGRLLLGSVASEVVRKAQLPVLLTRPDLRRPSRAIQRILLTVEGRETPQDLLETVKTLTGGSKTEIILFHVVAAVKDPAPQWGPAASFSTLSLPEHRLQEQADALEKEGYTAWPLVSTGEATAEILTQAAKLDVDLIALAPHARIGLERLFEGSVAEGVLRKSSVAVLLQKPLKVQKPVLLGERHE